ncbi:MAG: hypothetical protein H0W08_04305 [Acidobacteria bacterium]|nr:hypothetical protein [Acidobacteriota bacterium]
MKPSALAVAAVLAALELPAPQERTSEFMLGVLRRDGIVTPFAAFDGRRWSSRWPDDIKGRELPISLPAVPVRWWGIDDPPRTLAIWRDGERTGNVTLTSVVTTTLMCEPRLALKTDYKAATPPPPPFERPYPKDGVVASGDGSIEGVQSVEKEGTTWNQVAALLTAAFNRQETAASRAFTSWQHPVKEAQRQLVPITVEAMYRAPTEDPDWTAYYVEVVRQYPPGRDDKDGCGLATFAHGWVLVGAKGQSRAFISAKVAYCDRKGVSYMLPFGLIRANGHIYWVFQFSGFEEESYDVAEVTRSGVETHVSYRVGSCPA